MTAPNPIAKQIRKEIRATIPPRAIRTSERNSNTGNAPPLSYDEIEKPQKPIMVTRDAKMKTRKAGFRNIAIFIKH
jgi:hypothetical protein